MDTIIMDVCLKFINEVVTFFKGNPKDLTTIENELQKKERAFLLKMTKTYLEALDQAIAKDKKHRPKGVVIERKNEERTIFTSFGNLSFKRTYYKDKKNKSYLYLLDQAMGIEAYSRLSANLKAELINEASFSSYQKTSQYITQGEISKQTVAKEVQSPKRLDQEEEKEKRKVKILHVEADEDHVSLKDGSSVLVPLISIHEGKDPKDGNGRCKNIKHLSGYDLKGDDLWEKVIDYIYANYEVEKIENIYLHGDGANWIKKGKEELPKVKMVLDRYHLHKAVLGLTNSSLERAQIFKAFHEMDKESFKKSVKEILSRTKEEKKTERIKELKNYILHNWEGIVNYEEDEKARSGSTEGHISHVLADRLSRRPLAWSKKGLKAMAELRAFIFSGNRLKADDLIKKQEKENLSFKPTKKTIKEATKIFKEVSLEKTGNIPVLKSGKVSYLFQALNGLRNI